MLGNTLGGSLRTGVSTESIHEGKPSLNACVLVGWAKYMEWMYPVEVRFTSSKTFKAAGAVDAFASL